MKDKYESRLLSSLLPVCQNLHVHQLNVPSPFADTKDTRFQLHLQNGASTKNPPGAPRRSCYESADLKLMNKVDKSCEMPM